LIGGCGQRLTAPSGLFKFPDDYVKYELPSQTKRLDYQQNQAILTMP